MDLKEVIKMYGWVDYLDIHTNRIYHLGNSSYNVDTNKTEVPVSEDGTLIGVVNLSGDVKTELGGC